MKFSEYRSMDATAMVKGIKDKQFTAEELLEAASLRLDQVNPRLNAVVLDLTYESGRQLAQTTLAGALLGVPIVVKDMDGTLGGQVCTFGSRALADWVAPHDSELIARYRAQGVTFVGKTNCPEFGIMGITEPELHGPARNPWNTEHTPGGSSGGTAAAVAAGIVPVGHAGDGGGSIRIPAAYCGLFGLKPSRGRMPLGPDISEGWNGLALPHVISRSVRDSALFLQATHGPDLGAPYGEPSGPTDFVALLGRAPKKLRVGLTRRPMLADTQHREIVAAVDNTAGLLAEMGHDVVELDLHFDAEAVAQAYLTINAASVARDIAQTQVKTGTKPRPDQFEQATWFLGQVGQAVSARDLEDALAVAGSLGRSIARQMQDVDVHVSATTAQPPARIGELGLGLTERMGLSTIRRVSNVTGAALNPVLRQAIKQLASDSLSRTPNTQVFNMTGQPAMSVPLAMTSQGLPVGIQFAAAMGAEGLLLGLAAQLEEARPWFDRLPAL